MLRKLLGSLAVVSVLMPLAQRAPVGAQFPNVLTPPSNAALSPPVDYLPWGVPWTGDIPLAGDWDGDGTTTIGVYRTTTPPNVQTFYLRNSNSAGNADVPPFLYGVGGDRPLAGDWDGDGTTTIGVRRGAQFYLRNSNTTGQADVTVTFGLATDFPVVGDWDGNGTTTIGVWRMGAFYLRNENTPGPADVVVPFGLDVDQPVVGDWDGNGTTTVGVYRSALSLGGIALYWRNANSIGPADGVQRIGTDADSALAGDWDGNGTDTIGLRRQYTFYLADSNSTSTASTVFGYGALTFFMRCWDGDFVYHPEACPLAAHGRSALYEPDERGLPPG